jgi:glycosyltransferase involved in cell wall biosynthesis
MRVGTLGVNIKDLSVTSRTRRLSAGALAAADDPFTIGYFARIAPEKGLHNLADAYRMLRLEKGLPPSRLVAAGYLVPEHEPYLETIAEGLRAAGLGAEFVYRGTVDRARKVKFFHDIDVLSVPSPYHEPKGLYLLEAMACGVPVVQPNHGAFPEIIERTGGGLLARSESGADVADALYDMWKDPARAAEMGRRGAEGVRRHYTVTHMAEKVLQIYQEVVT